MGNLFFIVENAYFCIMKNIIEENFEQMLKILNEFMRIENYDKIEQAALLMKHAFQKGGKIIACGNGGSHCDAMHFAEELTGRFRENRKPFPAIAISDPSHLSCVANDFGFDFVFSRYIEALGKPEDILLAISTSGNSKNILEACKKAREMGLKIVALTGNYGGKLAELADVEIRVPYVGYADRIQEIHIKIIHTLIQLIEKE
ncbi:MAG: phosphoheptose isomerase [Bacteroidia bacterium]|nr:MAG: phosphoheptose isomerase [Bacteroidia bacterium]